MTDPTALPTVPGYDVVEQIDVGGFSRVYRAIQRRFERPVAIKVLNAGFADERQRRAFERECRVMGQLSSHPNIVTVYDSATAQVGGHELPAIVMELYTGTYRNAGRLSIPEVVDVGVKIADALDHIHRREIVHRDLKPHNLFISEHGEPAIADFGISTIGGEHTTGARFTLKYAPPELLREGVADASGDIYSLGATLFQLATGHVPFDGTDDADVVRRVMVAPPPPLERSDAPPGLERIIHRCLAKYPSERPATAGEVAEAFRRLQSEVGLPGRRRAVPEAGGARAPDGGATRGRVTHVRTEPRHEPAAEVATTPTDATRGTVDRRGPADDDALARPTPGRPPRRQPRLGRRAGAHRSRRPAQPQPARRPGRRHDPARDPGRDPGAGQRLRS